MVTFVYGDIFKSPAQLLMKTVNCVGAMGKGVALKFKSRYPRMLGDTKVKCDENKVKYGQPYLWEDHSVQTVNFLTKRNWRHHSWLQDSEEGPKYLAGSYEQMGIQFIAMPALGCGFGGLEWAEIQPLIIKHLGALSDLDVYVYVPQNVAAIKDDADGRHSESQVGDEKISARPREF